MFRVHALFLLFGAQFALALECGKAPPTLLQNPFLGVVEFDENGALLPYTVDEAPPDGITFVGKGAFGVVQKLALQGVPVAVKTVRVTPKPDQLPPTSRQAGMSKVLRLFARLDKDPSLTYESVALQKEYLADFESLQERETVKEAFRLLDQNRANVAAEISINRHLLKVGRPKGLRVAFQDCYVYSNLAVVQQMEVLTQNCFSKDFFIDKLSQWTFDQRLSFYCDVLRQYALLHEAGVAHCDVKDANMGLNSAGEVVLLDFGLSKMGQPCKGGSQQTVSPEVAFPELQTGDPTHLTKSDVYSLGIILIDFELFAAGQDFAAGEANTVAETPDEHSETEVQLQKMVADLPVATKGVAPPAKGQFLAGLWKGLLQKMVVTAAASRPSMADCLFEATRILVLARSGSSADLQKLSERLGGGRKSLALTQAGLAEQMAKLLQRAVV